MSGVINQQFPLEIRLRHKGRCLPEMTLNDLTDCLRAINQANFIERGLRQAGILDGNGNGKSKENEISLEPRSPGVERGR